MRTQPGRVEGTRGSKGKKKTDASYLEVGELYGRRFHDLHVAAALLPARPPAGCDVSTERPST
jgi:hypothetical protein